MSSNPYAEPPFEPPIAGVVRIEGATLTCKRDVDLRKYCIHTGEPSGLTAAGMPLSLVFHFAVHFATYARWLPVLRAVFVPAFVILGATTNFGLATFFATAASIVHWTLTLVAARKLMFAKATVIHKGYLPLRRLACYVALYPAIVFIGARGILFIGYGVQSPWALFSPTALLHLFFVVVAIVGE